MAKTFSRRFSRKSVLQCFSVRRVPRNAVKTNIKPTFENKKQKNTLAGLFIKIKRL